MQPMRSPLVETAHTALRIAAGFLFWQHGVQKVLGGLGGFGPQGGTAPLFTEFGLAGVLEFFGGALIVLGLFTRPVALILAVEMLVAYVWKHLPNGFWPIENRGELALLYMFVFLYVLAAGPGKLSLDGLIARRRKAAAAPAPGEPEPEEPGLT